MIFHLGNFAPEKWAVVPIHLMAKCLSSHHLFFVHYYAKSTAGKRQCSKKRVHMFCWASNSSLAFLNSVLKYNVVTNCLPLDSVCDSVGWVIASDSRGLQFEYSHWQTFMNNICLLSWKDEYKEKRPEMAHLQSKLSIHYLALVIELTTLFKLRIFCAHDQTFDW